MRKFSSFFVLCATIVMVLTLGMGVMDGASNFIAGPPPGCDGCVAFVAGPPPGCDGCIAFVAGPPPGCDGCIVSPAAN